MLSFRPRPIDINKAIPIVRDLPEDEEADLRNSGRSVPQMPTGMEAEEEEEAHIQEAIKRSLKAFSDTNDEAIEIPTPRVIIVEGYDTENVKPFIRPQTYVRFKERPLDEIEQSVEYDLEPSDEEFLNVLNSGTPSINSEQLEYLIDRLEKEADKLDKMPTFQHVENVFGQEYKTTLLQAIYDYWRDKRKRENMPLIYRLMRPPEPEDPSPYRAFRIRNEEKFKRKSRKNDNSSLVKMRQLRLEMERVRMLLEMVKKREREKKEIIEYFQQIFDLQCELLRLPPLEKADKPEKKYKQQQQSSANKKKRELEDIYDYYYDEEDEESLLSAEESEEESDSDISFSEDDEDSPFTSPRQSVVPISTFGQNGFVPLSSARSTWTSINLGDNIPIFRGRARIGRGGRIIYDRRSHMPRSQGVVRHFETDEEYNPRVNSLSAMYKSGHHPVVAGRTDAEKLLKKLQMLNKKRKKSFYE